MTSLNPEMNDTRPRIWAVGGGKGGVGKTVIIANTAISLAQQGKRCVALDLDLGGANLHTVLGVPDPDRSLSDFLRRKVDSLADTMVPTPYPNLQFISGSKALLEIANPKFSQKEKLIRHITSLEVDYVLLDLGAGSAFNTLDFFLAADEGVLVVLLADAIDKAMEEKVSRGIQSPRTLINNVLQINPEAGHALEEEARGFKPNIIVNQARKHDDHELGTDIVQACKDYFGINIRNLGHIDEDDSLKEAVRLRRAVVDSFPVSSFTRAIHSIVRNLLGTQDGST
jgi:flagellar biosynthesis protein FlhG